MLMSPLGPWGVWCGAWGTNQKVSDSLNFIIPQGGKSGVYLKLFFGPFCDTPLVSVHRLWFSVPEVTLVFLFGILSLQGQ